MCDWVILLYRRKLTEHCKPAMMEKIKVIINEKKEFDQDSNTNIYFIFVFIFIRRHEFQKSKNLEDIYIKKIFNVLTQKFP